MIGQIVYLQGEKYMENNVNRSLTTQNTDSLLIMQTFLRKNASHNRTKKYAAFRLIGVLLLVSILVLSFSSCIFTLKKDESVKKDGLTSYITTVMKDKLKNPESFQLHHVLVMNEFENKDYTYYSVSIDYSAQNGFGGYNRDEDYTLRFKVHNKTDKVYEISYAEYDKAWDEYMDNRY